MRIPEWTNRATWMVGLSSVLSAVGLLPLFESPSLEWTGWLETPGGLAMGIILRFFPEADFLVALCFGVVVNVVVWTLMLWACWYVIHRWRRRAVARA
jgi:hypothetical protein